MLLTNLTEFIQNFNSSNYVSAANITQYVPDLTKIDEYMSDINITQYVPDLNQYSQQIQKTRSVIYKFCESRLEQYYNTISQQTLKFIVNIEGEHLKTYFPIYLAFLCICILSILYYRKCFNNLLKINNDLKNMYELKSSSFEQLEKLSSQYIENSSFYQKKYLFVLSQFLDDMQLSKKNISHKEEEIKMLTEQKNLLSIHNKALQNTNKMLREKYDKKVLTDMLNDISDNIPVKGCEELCKSIKKFANYLDIDITIIQNKEQNTRKNPPRNCKPTVFNIENSDSDFEN